MPRDIKLDSTTHDIDLTKGITLTKTGAETLAQNIKVALLLRTREWAPNITVGVPYISSIFRNKGSKSFVDSFFQSYILKVPGVGSLTSYASTIDTERRLNVRFTVVQEQTNTTIEVTL